MNRIHQRTGLGRIDLRTSGLRSLLFGLAVLLSTIGLSNAGFAQAYKYPCARGARKGYDFFTVSKAPAGSCGYWAAARVSDPAG